MKKSFWNNGYFIFLCLLLATDLVYIGLHLAHVYTPYLPRSLYSVEQDKGYAEFFEYTKEFWIIILLTLLFIKEATLTNFSWLMVFVYVLFDDSLQIHENFGALVSSALAFAAELGLRAQDWGELFVTGLMGILLLTPVAIGYMRADARARTHTIMLSLLLGMLVFFGVFVDMMHSFFDANAVLGLIEDGGEMVSVSAILAYVYQHSFSTMALPRTAPAPLASQNSAAPESLNGLQPAMASSSLPPNLG
ncbi:MAG TPA: hypothetical protein VFX01_00355 [Methylophilaceae bacterium]|nr:hypothetical protein [Methylophilaceae bacterium]